MKTTLMAALMGLAGIVAAEAAEPGWTGWHVGLHGGYGWTRGGVSAMPGDPETQRVVGGSPVVPPISAPLAPSGVLGGGQIGYDWQFAGRGVVGVEADIAASSLKSSSSVPLLMYGLQPATFDASRNVDWFGTLRGRIGFLAAADVLIFATGGFAYGRVSEQASLSLPPGQSTSVGGFSGYGFGCGPLYGIPSCFTGNASRIATGWTAGIGGEKRFTANVSLKVEYLHMDFGDRDSTLTSIIPGAIPLSPSFLNARSSATVDLVRAGSNYNF